VPDPVRDLVRETERLVGRMRALSLSAWQAPVPGGGSRADWAASLSGELVAIGRRAGSGVPAEVELPRLADHAIADQVAVLAEDLIAALNDPAVRPVDWRTVAREARAVMSAAWVDLEPRRPIGFRPQ
jgi:hypothetical protein